LRRKYPGIDVVFTTTVTMTLAQQKVTLDEGLCDRSASKILPNRTFSRVSLAKQAEKLN